MEFGPPRDRSLAACLSLSGERCGFAGGYHFETIPLGFAVFGAVMMPGAWGEAYTRDIEKYTRFAGMWTGEDLPQASNRITRDATKKDRFGLPSPHVHYDDHVNDKRIRNHAFTQGRALYDALGAERCTRRRSRRATTWAVAA
jgi:hypothetical protein